MYHVYNGSEQLIAVCATFTVARDVCQRHGGPDGYWEWIDNTPTLSDAPALESCDPTM